MLLVCPCDVFLFVHACVCVCVQSHHAYKLTGLEGNCKGVGGTEGVLCTATQTLTLNPSSNLIQTLTCTLVLVLTQTPTLTLASCWLTMSGGQCMGVGVGVT